FVVAKMRESGGESLARPGKIRGRARAPEKNGDVMKEARALLVRGEREVAREGPEVFRERACRRGVLALPQLLLEPEPVAVAVGGAGVSVGGTGVSVGGSGVAVGGTGVAVAVGGGSAGAAWRADAAVGRAVAGTGVAVRVGLGAAVAVGGIGAGGRIGLGTAV